MPVPPEREDGRGVSTDLLIAYRIHRDQGHGHHAALKALARRFDIDKETVSRVIERAERADAPNRNGGDRGGASR